MHGLRHAATLLLTNRLRALSAAESRDAVTLALKHLADELVALARDMHAPSDEAGRLIDAFESALARLPQQFDRESVKRYARDAIAQLRESQPRVEPRDLCLIYVPADRLPIAAPLAIELTKRRVSVAFSEYEVISTDELARALARGLGLHRGCVILRTQSFSRAALASPEESPRLRVVNDAAESTCLGLVAWARSLRK